MLVSFPPTCTHLSINQTPINPQILITFAVKIKRVGLVEATILLSNAKDVSLIPMEIRCLVDTGATYLCIPETIALQLKLEELQKRDVKRANGHVVEVPYVGPVKVQFENRICFVGAMVMGDTPLLGAIPMEDMDLLIHPKLQKLTVYPDRPNVAGGLAM